MQTTTETTTATRSTTAETPTGTTTESVTISTTTTLTTTITTSASEIPSETQIEAGKLVTYETLVELVTGITHMKYRFENSEKGWATIEYTLLGGKR